MKNLEVLPSQELRNINGGTSIACLLIKSPFPVTTFPVFTMPEQA